MLRSSQNMVSYIELFSPALSRIRQSNGCRLRICEVLAQNRLIIENTSLLFLRP